MSTGKLVLSVLGDLRVVHDGPDGEGVVDGALDEPADLAPFDAPRDWHGRVVVDQVREGAQALHV